MKMQKKMLWIAFPVIIGVSLDQINALVDRTLASQIIIGGISALNYANKLNGFIQGIFVLSIVTVLFPIISRLATEGRILELKTSVSNAIVSIQLLVIPVVAMFLIFPTEVITFMFGRGSFDRQAIDLTSEALFFYSFGILAIGLRDLLSRVFFSLQDTKTPMINASIAMAINITLNFVLSKYMGLGGLALATSISAFISVILMYISLHRKIGSINFLNICIVFIKILGATFVMAIISKFIFRKISHYISGNNSLIIVLIIGSIVYVTLLSLMNIELVNKFILSLKKKLRIKLS